MSPGQKRVLIALALLVLVFIAVILWGQTRPACSGSALKCSKDYRPGGGIKALGGLFSRLGPKIELPQKRYELKSTGSLQIGIGPSSDKIRTLKLRAVQGAIELSATTLNKADDPDLSDQKEPTLLPREADDFEERQRLAFAFPSGGGQLTIKCRTPPCVVEVL